MPGYKSLESLSASELLSVVKQNIPDVLTEDHPCMCSVCGISPAPGSLAYICDDCQSLDEDCADQTHCSGCGQYSEDCECDSET